SLEQAASALCKPGRLRLRPPSTCTRKRKECSSPSCIEVPRLLRHPAAVGVWTGGDIFDPPRRERDEEQDVDPLQKGGLDAEKATQPGLLAGAAASRLCRGGPPGRPAAASG